MDKVCIYCKETKPINQFYIDRQKKDGLRPRCKKCEKEYNIDIENRKKYEKEYWDKRRDRKREIVLKSYYNHIEDNKAKRKKYLSTPNGKAMQRKYWQNRMALEKNAFVESVDIMLLFKEAGGKCSYCGKILDFNNFHVDHYIPISKGGKHEKSNLKISCQHCNLSKGAKMPEEGYLYQLV